MSLFICTLFLISYSLCVAYVHCLAWSWIEIKTEIQVKWFLGFAFKERYPLHTKCSPCNNNWHSDCFLYFNPMFLLSRVVFNAVFLSLCINSHLHSIEDCLVKIQIDPSALEMFLLWGCAHTSDVVMRLMCPHALECILHKNISRQVHREGPHGLFDPPSCSIKAGIGSSLRLLYLGVNIYFPVYISWSGMMYDEVW